MASPEPGEASKKKRRFFAEREVELTDGHSPEPERTTLPHSPKRRQIEGFPAEPSSKHASAQSSNGFSPEPYNSPHRTLDVASHHNTDLSSIAGSPKPSPAGPSFDRATFEAFVGTKVDDDVLKVIYDNCGGSVERAVNMYLDGTWRSLKKKPATVRPTKAAHPSGHTLERSRSSPSKSEAPPRRPQREPMPESRYIGALGVAGWATRSGAGLLKSGDVIRIERQKVQAPSFSSKTKTNTKTSAAALPRGSSSKRVDVVVRFTDNSGAEIGRLEKEAANWVSTLIDQKVCKFEGTCVWAPDVLRTNDTVYLQLRCSMKRSAFANRAFKGGEDRNRGIFEERESSEERDLRLRQVALVRLFQELNLFPTKASAASSKHGRQGLLDAAEMAEKKEKDMPKPANR